MMTHIPELLPQLDSPSFSYFTILSVLWGRLLNVIIMQQVNNSNLTWITS